MRAAKGAADGIFYNQGQVCTAASRLYVHASVLDQVLEELQRHAAAHVLGNGLDPANSMGPLVSAPAAGLRSRATCSAARRRAPN